MGAILKMPLAKGLNGDWAKKGKIIGVVKDFHFNSLQQKLIPVVMHIMPLNSGWYGYVSVRVNALNIQHTIQSLETVWKSVLPDNPFEYSFVDEDYNRQYQSEQRLGSLSVVFSIFTIFISCLGLFGAGNSSRFPTHEGKLVSGKCLALPLPALPHYYQKISCCWLCYLLLLHRRLHGG
ncbi:MAG: hypothetical protein WDO19_28085 [Bacteroidota bacterium]